MIDLLDYGFDEAAAEVFSQLRAGDPGLHPARIIAEHKTGYQVMTEAGELPATLMGKYRLELGEGGWPTVGDFVAVHLTQTLDRAVITRLLPRRSCFYRTDGFTASGVQVLGANIDTVFICMSLNQNFNLRRLERYVIMTKASRSEGVVLLTKADLCGDVELKKSLCEAVCPGLPVLVISARTSEGMELLEPWLIKGRTVAALGSSGVGKSTLLNRLCCRELMKTAGVREDDDMGRHTTVHRQLFMLPSGTLYLDTPGLRELGIVAAEDAVSEYYEDIEILAEHCKFDDCRHRTEPGCAVRLAIEEGRLEAERMESYLRYRRQARYSARKERVIRLRMNASGRKPSSGGKKGYVPSLKEQMEEDK